MDKLYNKIGWINHQPPYINDTNLNKIDDAIDGLDDRIITVDTQKANRSDLLQCVKDVTYNPTTGVLIFTWQDGTTMTVDLNVEKIPISMGMDTNGVITMTTADGTKYTCDIKDLIKTYQFQSGQVNFETVADEDGNYQIRATIKAGAITEDMLQPNFLADVRTAAGQATAAATTAAASESSAAKNATAAAGDATAAALSATAAAQSEQTSKASETVAIQSATTAQTIAAAVEEKKEAAEAAAEQAFTSAITAGQCAGHAADSKTAAVSAVAAAEQNAQTSVDNRIMAQSYAVGGTGTRPGEDTDNAFYYMQQAKAQTGGIPTRLSELENDTGFLTAAADNLINYYKTSQLYTKSEVDNKLSSIPKFGIEVVDALPTDNISDSTIYLLQTAAAGTNKCREYIYAAGAWEEIGIVDIDLSDYLLINGDGSQITSDFAEAADLTNLTPGENHRTLFGKIAKAISALMSHLNDRATSSKAGHVTVDIALSKSSTNPVQNKAVQAALDGKLASAGDASNTTVAFTESVALANITTGDKMSVIMGKVAKAISTLIDSIPQIATGSKAGLVKSSDRVTVASDGKMDVNLSDVPLSYSPRLPKIAANSDLDDYVTDGTYVCGSAGNAGTLAHTPPGLNAGFLLQVSNWSATKIQRLETWGADYVAKRFKINDTWSSWVVSPRRHEIETICNKMGNTDISALADGTLSGAVSACFTSVSDGKSLVASAITDKGVATAADATFAAMAANIELIETGGGEAVVSQLTGSAAVSTTGTAITRTFAAQVGKTYYAIVTTVANTGGYADAYYTFGQPTMTGNAEIEKIKAQSTPTRLTAEYGPSPTYCLCETNVFKVTPSADGTITVNSGTHKGQHYSPQMWMHVDIVAI